MRRLQCQQCNQEVRLCRNGLPQPGALIRQVMQAQASLVERDSEILDLTGPRGHSRGSNGLTVRAGYEPPGRVATEPNTESGSTASRPSKVQVTPYDDSEEGSDARSPSGRTLRRGPQQERRRLFFGLCAKGLRCKHYVGGKATNSVSTLK